MIRRLVAMVAGSLLLASMPVASPARAWEQDRTANLDQGGAHVWGKVDFIGLTRVHVWDYKLADESCDSSDVYNEIHMNRIGEWNEERNSSGCGSKVNLSDADHEDREITVTYVQFKVCVDSIGGNECKWGDNLKWRNP